MNLRFRLHQTTTTGLQLSLRKVLRKLIAPLRDARGRSRAYSRPSYDTVDAERHGHFHTHLRGQIIQLGDNRRRILLDCCSHYVRHEFFYSGCGWLTQHHTATVPGLEGIRYTQESFPYEFDEAGDWVAHLVNPSNSKRSQEIWAQLRRSTLDHHASTQPYQPIDWQRDMCSGYSWTEGQWFRDLRIGVAKGADPKRPWDFGRLHHLLHMAVAAGLNDSVLTPRLLTEEFRCQLIDFIALNPPGFGIQWKSPMDVAIRLANILCAYDLFLCFGVDFDSEFVELFEKSCYEHARFVLDNLEWSDGMRANHYLSNLAGLSLYAHFVPDSGLAKRIQALLRESLPQEILYQFLDDGSNFEASLSYHSLSAEMLVWTIAALDPEVRRDLLSVPRVTERLRALRDFSLFSMYPSGRSPQIGDNDGGHFLPFMPVLHNDADLLQGHDRRYVVDLVQTLLDSIEKDSAAHVFNALMQTTIAEHDQRAPLVYTHESDPSTTLAQHHSFGLYRLDGLNFTCFLRAGSIGQNGKGGHAHNDQLSLTVESAGTEIFCDNGTYLYTAIAEHRNLFRSTAMHNTLSIDRQEQNTLPTGGGEALFWMMSDRARPQILQHDRQSWEATHGGFSVIHRRRVELRDNGLRIVDQCDTTRLTSSAASVRFHIHPQCHVERMDARTIRITTQTAQVDLHSPQADVSLESSWYSPAYGSRVSSQCCMIRFIAPEIETLLSIATL